MKRIYDKKGKLIAVQLDRQEQRKLALENIKRLKSQR